MALSENASQVAERVSPLQYVRAGLPPIITIRGDADPTVPFSYAVRRHEAQAKAGVPNQLVTIPGGKHLLTAESVVRRAAVAADRDQDGL